MKKELNCALKEVFRGNALMMRGKLDLTQAEMAKKLNIAERSYAALECGESCCGALTFVVFLLYICDDQMCFLAQLNKAFDAVLQETIPD